MPRSLIEKSILKAGRIFDLWLPMKMQYEEIPGLSIAVSHHGKIIYQNNFGYADVKLKKKVTPKTIFRIASISKTFTTVAVLHLVEQGIVRLEDHITKYVPWFDVHKGKMNSKKITVKEILSHTAGVFRDVDSVHFEKNIYPADLEKYVSGKSLDYEDGTRFKYSNFGFSLLGYLIENASGMKYFDYMMKNVIRPLRLKMVRPDLAKDMMPYITKGYSRPIPGEKQIPFPKYYTKAYAPAAGFCANAVDLSKFVSSLFIKKASVIGDKIKKEMFKERTYTGYEKYCMGIYTGNVGKRKIFGHAGEFEGFTSRISLDMENNISLVILTNRMLFDIEKINNGIFETIYAFIDAGEKKSQIGDFRKYEGTYRNIWRDTTVAGMNKKLIAFNPKFDSPFYDYDFLLPKRKGFLVNTENGYDNPGEIAEFRKNKSTGKMELILGDEPLVKIC